MPASSRRSPTGSCAMSQGIVEVGIPVYARGAHAELALQARAGHDRAADRHRRPGGGGGRPRRRRRRRRRHRAALAHRRGGQPSSPRSADKESGMDALVQSGATVAVLARRAPDGRRRPLRRGLSAAVKRVFYNSCADAALYGMIREAAAGRCELVTLERDDDAERIAKLAEADAAIVASTRFTRPLIEAGDEARLRAPPGRRLPRHHRHRGAGRAPHPARHHARRHDRRRRRAHGDADPRHAAPAPLRRCGAAAGPLPHQRTAAGQPRAARPHRRASRHGAYRPRRRRAAEALRRDADLFRSRRRCRPRSSVRSASSAAASTSCSPRPTSSRCTCR